VNTLRPSPFSASPTLTREKGRGKGRSPRALTRHGSLSPWYRILQGAGTPSPMNRGG